jgi:hypothetical protein
VVFGWWAFLIHFSRGGEWSSMYLTGSQTRIPDALKSERIYLFPASSGYDGQFYHFIAHDPWLGRGFQASVDNPPLRWRRILVSALAWGLALGRDGWIDPAFYVVLAGFIFLGGWWLALFFKACGAPPWWGLAFLLAPAALATMDRIVVDLALTSLTAGFLYYAQTNRPRALWLVLAACVLARENGLALVAGWVAWQVLQRQFRQAAVFAAAALPAAVWWIHVAHRTAYCGMPGWSVSVPPLRLIRSLLHPIEYPFSAAMTRLILTFDYLAVAGSVLAIGLGLAELWRARRWLRPALAAWGLFGVLLTASASLDVFQDVFSHARLLSPLILLLAADGAARREWIAAAPMVLAALRIGMPLASNALGILLSLLR